jgi:hemoglobin-like flavoprotein
MENNIAELMEKVNKQLADFHPELKNIFDKSNSGAKITKAEQVVEAMVKINPEQEETIRGSVDMKEMQSNLDTIQSSLAMLSNLNIK